MEGILEIEPEIKNVTFKNRGKINIFLKDGREIILPLLYFPSIKKLSVAQRKKWYVIDNELLSFDDSNEYVHIEQILGNYQNYKFKCK
ncbi:MAG: DUF2442 domain-containing protein [Cytophagales bacterium]|nr:DUF2442 domain-containing protein [Cytophagales bacterium]